MTLGQGVARLQGPDGVVVGQAGHVLTGPAEAGVPGVLRARGAEQPHRRRSPVQALMIVGQRQVIDAPAAQRQRAGDGHGAPGLVGGQGRGVLVGDDRVAQLGRAHGLLLGQHDRRGLAVGAHGALAGGRRRRGGGDLLLLFQPLLGRRVDDEILVGHQDRRGDDPEDDQIAVRLVGHGRGLTGAGG